MRALFLVALCLAVTTIVGCGGGMKANGDVSSNSLSQAYYVCAPAATNGSIEWCQMPNLGSGTGTTGTGTVQ